MVAVGPEPRAIALLLALDKVTSVFGTVRVSHHSLPVHHVLLKLALVDFAFVDEAVDTVAMELAVEKIALVRAAVGLEVPLAGLQPVHEVTLVAYCSLLPLLDAAAMLLVVEPLAIVEGLLDRTVIGASALCFAALPVAPVRRAIRLHHLTTSVEPAAGKVAAVLGVIGEIDDAKALRPDGAFF